MHTKSNPALSVSERDLSCLNIVLFHVGIDIQGVDLQHRAVAGTDADADLSAFIEPLDTLREIVTDQDMPDEVRAKLCKACAFARRGLTDADNMALSLKLLREAMHLNPNAGVKREIATLSRALKKADSAAEPEDASAQQAQDESSKSKKTTRKPATRKTTATQKAKRG